MSTYYVGNMEMNDLRQRYREMHGDVPLKKMHNEMISFGSPAPKYVKELLGL